MSQLVGFKQNNVNITLKFLEEVYYALFSPLKLDINKIANRRRLDEKIIQILLDKKLIQESEGIYSWVDRKQKPNMKLALKIHDELYDLNRKKKKVRKRYILEYHEAKEILKTLDLGLTSEAEYRQAMKEGKIPKGFPKDAYHTYYQSHETWKGWNDFLGL